MKKIYSFILLPTISIILSLIFCEIILRIKHSVNLNYDIEMWKYAKELKIKIDDNKINHVHRKNESGSFQGVDIKINNHGQRDIDYDNEFLRQYEKRFLIIGSSIPLGWGVKRENTYPYLLNELAKKNNKNWIFINGGIGNYNSQRYVNNFLKNWSNLDFNYIIINYFVNDAELLENKKTNFFIKHTHLGVVLWKLLKSFEASLKKENLVSYYENIYNEKSNGFKINISELKKLNEFCNNNNVKCILVNMPDIHQLNPYKLNFINKKIENLADEINLKYIDLLPVLENIDEKKLWNKYQDPHPNSLGHEIISKEIFQKIN
jgi:hypothetical protein